MIQRKLDKVFIKLILSMSWLFFIIYRLAIIILFFPFRWNLNIALMIYWILPPKILINLSVSSNLIRLRFLRNLKMLLFLRRFSYNQVNRALWLRIWCNILQLCSELIFIELRFRWYSLLAWCNLIYVLWRFIRVMKDSILLKL